MHDIIDVNALQQAQDELYRTVQDQYFLNEKKEKMVPRESPMTKLDLFLDNKGIIRVRSRLINLCLSKENHTEILQSNRVF